MPLQDAVMGGRRAEKLRVGAVRRRVGAARERALIARWPCGSATNGSGSSSYQTSDLSRSARALPNAACSRVTPLVSAISKQLSASALAPRPLPLQAPRPHLARVLLPFATRYPFAPPHTLPARSNHPSHWLPPTVPLSLKLWLAPQNRPNVQAALDPRTRSTTTSITLHTPLPPPTPATHCMPISNSAPGSC